MQDVYKRTYAIRGKLFLERSNIVEFKRSSQQLIDRCTFLLESVTSSLEGFLDINIFSHLYHQNTMLFTNYLVSYEITNKLTNYLT